MELRDYQKNIIRQGRPILERYKLLYLNMEMRTGKTITALHIAADYTNVLFVTKKKAIQSIESDYNEFNFGFTLSVVNYESLHKKVKGNYDLYILDECHTLGAYPKPNKRTKQLKLMVKNTPVIYLTGTATPESYSQIYHQLWISDNSPFKKYKNFYAWAKDFVYVTQFRVNGYSINNYSAAYWNKIKPYINKFFITYTQKQANFNQRIIEKVINIPINKGIHSLVEILLQDRYYQLSNGDEIVCDTAIKLQNKIHQIYSGTIITEQGNRIVLDNSKAIYIKENYKNKKIAIFYLFKAEGELLRDTFVNSTEDPQDFNEEKDLVFISQITKSSQGVNLSTADILIFYNIHFSYLQYSQAIARSQFKDRKAPAVIHWIFSDNGIENKIYQTVTGKSNYTAAYFKEDFMPYLRKAN